MAKANATGWARAHWGLAAMGIGITVLFACGDPGDTGTSSTPRGIAGSGGSAGMGGAGGTGGSDSIDAAAGPDDDAAPSANEPEPGALAGITRMHNEVRSEIPVPALIWDPAIAAIAQAYAEKCTFDHSGAEGYGENLAADSPPGQGVASAFGGWVDEQRDFDYLNNKCAPGMTCGHYTQVVWGATTRIGCGVAACTTGSPFGAANRWEIWVCNYAPPGNIVGEKPY